MKRASQKRSRDLKSERVFVEMYPRPRIFTLKRSRSVDEKGNLDKPVLESSTLTKEVSFKIAPFHSESYLKSINILPLINFYIMIVLEIDHLMNDSIVS